MIKKIIWGDDEPDVRANYVAILENICKEEGVDVDVSQVDTAKGLVEAATNEIPDLIFTDENYKSREIEETGTAAIGKLRKQGITTPCYVVSNVYCESDEDLRLNDTMNKACGGNGFFSKRETFAEKTREGIRAAVREHLL